MQDHDLMESRQKAANQVFDEFDFGTYVPEDASGWEYTLGDQTDGFSMSRVVYYANDGGDTIAGRFTVDFPANSAEASGATAYADNNPIAEWEPEQASAPTP